ncbi:hypothetical protein HN51_045622 [Arachis hypogaea]|uniref:F-box/kelch-repeat protein At3g23880-like n=1 Tax=Arachis hypogaea TaxID=3818 RepID=UPI0007AF4B9E
MSQDECDLPEGLIWEILLWLPGRLLLQLRTVCRSWNSLISSHEFVMHHHQRSTQPRLVYCSLESEGIDFMQCSVSSLLYNKQPTRIEPLQMKYKIFQGSCNGLLCLCEGLPYKNLTLFNPCTRWVSLIVPFEYPHGDDPHPVFCGFGYDALRNKYKFVTCSRTSITAGGLGGRAKVCSLDANPSWKTVDHPMFPYFTCCHSGTFVSGSLNWIAHDHPSKNKEDDDPFKLLEWFILTFEMETESFGRLCLPRNNHTYPGFYGEVPSLHVLKNLLSICFHPAYENTAAFTIWIMKEYGVEKSWTILLTIRFRDGIIPPNIWLEPLYISEDDILLALGKFYRGKLFAYNFRIGKVDISSNSLSIYPLSKLSNGRFFHGYHESLISCLP